MFDEEDIDEEEYIIEKNDPEFVEKIRNEDYTFPTNDETIEFDEVFESIKTKITNISNYDHMMDEKVFDFLRKGGFRR